MLQISLLREKPEFVIERLAVKNFDAKELVHLILSIDEDRRKIQNEQDGLLNQQNTLAKQVGDLYKSGQKAEADDLKNKSTALKASSQELGEKLALTEQQLHQELVKLPNLPSELVPPGKTPAVSYTHLRAHETVLDLVCRLLLEKKKKKRKPDICIYPQYTYIT